MRNQTTVSTFTDIIPSRRFLLHLSSSVSIYFNSRAYYDFVKFSSGQAFIDVEKDLTERGTPMDRLICGDVGFGKTEVALRAIFCVVAAGKQAMVLAPTIVLAKQHFDVISERFSHYPNIKVGLLSRFQVCYCVNFFLSINLQMLPCLSYIVS